MQIRTENLQSLLASTMTDRSCHLYSIIILTTKNFHYRRIPKNFRYTTRQRQKSFCNPFWGHRRNNFEIYIKYPCIII